MRAALIYMQEELNDCSNRVPRRRAGVDGAYARARRLGRELTCLGLLRWIAGMAGRL